MGDTGPSLPVKALMYMEIAQGLIQLVDGLDTGSSIHKIIEDKIDQTLNAALAEVDKYKEDLNG